MFTSVGKKQMIAAIDTFGARPLPSSSTRIGAFATTGIELISTAIGKNACSIALAMHEHRGDGDGRRLPSRNPHTASSAVGHRFAISMSNFSTSVAATTSGAGAMNGLTWKNAISAHQTNSSAAAPTSGSSRRLHRARAWAASHAARALSAGGGASQG